MSAIVAMDGRAFRLERSMIDATSMNRPDESWSFIDKNGHEHRWHVDGKPVTRYDPTSKFETPTLVWKHERWGYYPDGSRYSVGHHRCAQCKARVPNPGTKADDCQQYVPGLTSYYIDDRSVTREEFMRLAREAFPDADWTKVE